MNYFLKDKMALLGNGSVVSGLGGGGWTLGSMMTDSINTGRDWCVPGRHSRLIWRTVSR